MAVTTLQLTAWLNQIKRDFITVSFTQDDLFKWTPSTKTIFHPEITEGPDQWTLLHEIGHAELGHSLYRLDIELIHQEALAWEKAEELAAHYGLCISPDHIQDHLDTYREWLHSRSLCPTCGQNGFQTTQNTYNCSNCRCLWRVNEARICGLRRVKITQRQFQQSQ